MIKETLGDATKEIMRAKKNLQRVDEQALRPEQRQSIEFSIHHIELAAQYIKSAFDAQVDMEKSLSDES